MSGATPIGNMVIKLGLDDADFGKGVANSKKQVKYLAKEMQANMKIADFAGNKLGKLGSRYDGLTRIIGAQEKQVTALKKAYEESFVDGKATDSTKRLAAEYEDARGKLANYNSQLQNTAGQMARLKIETEGFTGYLNKQGESLIKHGENIQKFGVGISTVGSTLTKGLTVPIVAGATAVTTAAIQWESAFAGVKKTVDEVVDSNGTVTFSYKELETGLRNLAKELPSTHAEIAAVAEAAGQLGIETPNVVNFTKTMIDLGESTNLSAETAATELARFANITGMSQDKFSNLGSSLVDLGNNFATTEGEISAMALRLAGAGSQIGMSEGDILGFSAALSSVGIEAEAGGSAFSKVMVQMQLASEKGMGSFDELIALGSQSGVSFETMSAAVQTGGKSLKSVASQMGLTNKQLSGMYKEADKSAGSLQNFAEVAGMTNAEFGNLFKTNPSEAIMAFVDGLAHAEEKGKSAIAVLDDMDITEVRLRDSLLRAANASGVFSEAVEMGNNAFSENTALSIEAGKRYETTESKLKMLKNEAIDAAIEFGGPMVDGLRDTLEASKPLIQGLGDLATKFSSLDKEQQQNIIKWGLMAAAAGPTLKLLGGGVSVIGSATTGVGKLSTGIVKLVAKSAEKKAIASLTTSVVGLGTSATAAAGTGTIAAGGIAGLGTSLAAIAGPAAIGVLAIGAVAGAAYVGKKAYDDHQLSGAKWGTEVTKEQDKVIEKSYQLQEEAVANINAYSDGVAGAAEKAVKSNQDIVDSIQSVLDKELERKRKATEEIDDPETKEKANASNDFDEKMNEQMVANAQARVDKINTIVNNASQNNRKISDAERQYINANYKLLSTQQLEAANFSKGEILAIQSAYQDDLSKMTSQKLFERENEVAKSLNKEQEYYKEQQKAIEGTWDKGTASYEAAMENLNTTQREKTDTMITGYAKLATAQGRDINSMAMVWEQYGYTVDEVTSLVNNSASLTQQNLEMFAHGMSDADVMWNELAFDPKTGEVKTNMADTLKDIAKTDEGWEQLEFMAKNADLTTNAKEEIAIAMGEVDKWQYLSMEDKLLLVDGDDAQRKLYDSIEELGAWDTYNADRKTLGVDNADAVYKLFESKGMLGDWIELPVAVKTLLANDPATLTIEQAQQALEFYEGLKPKTKELLGNNTDVNSKLAMAESKLNSYERNNPKNKHLHASAEYSQVIAARDAIASVRDKNVMIRVGTTGMAAIPNAKGTNFHPGGDMIVNDQKGPLYKEIVHEPGKEPYIPVGRNVYIPNAKRGTKVYRASKTKAIMKRMGVPKYAEGIGIPENSSLIQNMRSLTPKIDRQNINVNSNFNDDKLDQLISIMAQFGDDLKNMSIILDGRNLAKSIETRQNNKDRLNTILNGGRTV